MKRIDTELLVGLFMIVGIACLAYLSIKLGRMEIIGDKGYKVYAEFPEIGGLKNGASVEIAGVEVGRVRNISLSDYQAKIELQINSGVKIQEDAIAAVKTKGLLGEKYIQISPGGDEKIIPPEGKIRETQPPLDLEKAIGNFIFGKI
ncbi:MAG TPA: outer membrane lipid asymmetry maintenance protein MlaD [Thermodesulfobacteriota bacterium]|nr:outer membrane lipid asymmetry maintenance protein MlaD [Thermodesulfobacteriota bacterium]